MNKLLNLLYYYFTIILGLVIISWIIWARFLRERMIRDIPDGLFTEYRFWVLLYICMIYFYVVKQMIKPKTPYEILSWCGNVVFIPLKRLDEIIKYNKIIRLYYEPLMHKVVDNILSLNRTQVHIILYFFEIIPRMFLVSFLLLDTFYFNRLEFLYKIILLGLLPFFYRYVFYSIKDINDHWIEELEKRYSFVFVMEKGYEYNLDRKDNTIAKYHHSKQSVKEYVRIKYENILEHECDDDFPYEYIGDPYSTEELCHQYQITTYNNSTTALVYDDYIELKKPFYSSITKILELYGFIGDIKFVRETPFIKTPKIIIFVLYSICWSFILIVNYWCYPITFEMFYYLLNNIKLYLSSMEDPFWVDGGYSYNVNLITKEILILIVKHMINKLIIW